MHTPAQKITLDLTDWAFKSPKIALYSQMILNGYPVDCCSYENSWLISVISVMKLGVWCLH